MHVFRAGHDHVCHDYRSLSLMPSLAGRVRMHPASRACAAATILPWAISCADANSLSDIQRSCPELLPYVAHQIPTGHQRRGLIISYVVKAAGSINDDHGINGTASVGTTTTSAMGQVRSGSPSPSEIQDPPGLVETSFTLSVYPDGYCWKYSEGDGSQQIVTVNGNSCDSGPAGLDGIAVSVSRTPHLTTPLYDIPYILEAWRMVPQYRKASCQSKGDELTVTFSDFDRLRTPAFSAWFAIRYKYLKSNQNKMPHMVEILSSAADDAIVETAYAVVPDDSGNDFSSVTMRTYDGDGRLANVNRLVVEVRKELAGLLADNSPWPEKTGFADFRFNKTRPITYKLSEQLTEADIVLLAKKYNSQAKSGRRNVGFKDIWRYASVLIALALLVVSLKIYRKSA